MNGEMIMSRCKPKPWEKKKKKKPPPVPSCPPKSCRNNDITDFWQVTTSTTKAYTLSVKAG
jgi:hypothetical protein